MPRGATPQERSGAARPKAEREERERSGAARPQAEREDQERSESSARSPEVDQNDPELLATQAREAIEKSAAELRKQRVPIATEPPTVYRP